MTDIYHRDTTAALSEFNESIVELTPVVQNVYIELFENLANEVDGLLSRYADNISELEESKRIISELENK